METRVWLFGAVWLIAGALLFCGTSAQIIEINTMRYNKHENKAIRVIARFDRCPQHNFRNNFYHALTCAGFVRAHMDDLERKLNKKTLDWNADINEKLAENVDKPCYDNAQFKVFYYDENQLIFLRFGEHGSHVSYWITENLQKKYKNNENDVILEEDGPRQKDTSTTTTTTTTTTPRTTTTPKARKSSLLTTTTTTTTTTTPIPTTIEVIQLEIHEGNSSREYSDVPIWNDITDVPDIVQQKSRTIVLSMDYYDDQDAVDIAVKSKMKKLQPVKEKFTASTHLNGVFLVSLITAGFVFYM
ncbi:hypothetical protein QR680_006248 [Steinernema hermaphroditum]|uniref:Uncharacterized protein n=1 Tax=Steinernema hermaphroditum TaxID=289476 RepID=A0AA39LW83_9BILA|nr:hypothetical protein QR680_006248 [Steinernema hermaphroditum]